MSRRLKLLLARKILPAFNKNVLPVKLAESMEAYSKAGDDDFFVDLNRKFYSEPELKNFVQNLNCGECHKMRSVESDNDKVRILIERNYLIKNVLEEILTSDTKLEVNPKNITIDFSSPNIAKPFHVGHLRSTIIGNFISNINAHFHNNVIKINYLGDWGTQFGLLKIGLQEKNIDLDDLRKDPINILYSCYVHANQLASEDSSISDQARKYFSEVERGQSDLQSWREIRKYTVGELENIYQRLGVTFSTYNWESDYNAKAIENVMKLLQDESILKTDDLGRKVASLLNRDVVLIKSDRSTMYLSRDIAALLDRYKTYAFDEMLYVVDNSQTDHFVALFEIVGRLDKTIADKCRHIKFGRIKGMSTRKGNVVFLKDILDEARDKMYEKQLQSPNTRSASLNDNTCDTLGTTAVLINDLKQKRTRDYKFDWENALQTEGDTGIRLQYLHCRLWSLEQNCGATIPTECEPKYLQESVVTNLVAELAKFDDVLSKSKNEMEACVLVNYLFRLTRIINRAFNQLKIKGEYEPLASQRLLLFHASRLVVKKGLEILGVRPLCQM